MGPNGVGPINIERLVVLFFLFPLSQGHLQIQRFVMSVSRPTRKPKTGPEDFARFREEWLQDHQSGIPNTWIVPPFNSPIEYGQPIGPLPQPIQPGQEEPMYQHPYEHEADWSTDPNYDPDQQFGPGYFFSDDVYQNIQIPDPDESEFGPGYFLSDDVYQSIYDPTAPVDFSQPMSEPSSPQIGWASPSNSISDFDLSQGMANLTTGGPVQALGAALAGPLGTYKIKMALATTAAVLTPFLGSAMSAGGAAAGSALGGMAVNGLFNAIIGGKKRPNEGSPSCSCSSSKRPKYTCEEKCQYGRMMAQKCTGCRGYSGKKPGGYRKPYTSKYTYSNSTAVVPYSGGSAGSTAIVPYGSNPYGGPKPYRSGRQYRKTYRTTARQNRRTNRQTARQNRRANRKWKK